jgi:LacI family transcriptional regulator
MPDPGGKAIALKPARSSVTIRDVADRAGVALSSVSRVLNGHPAVSESLRQRVLSAVAEMDYQPDYTATSLRRGSTMTVAFLLRDIASPLFADMVKATETTLGDHGYSVLLVNSDGDPAREAANIQMLSRRRVDGLIVSLTSERDRDTIAALRSFRPPIVLIDRTIADLEASAVVSDHFGGLSAATRHLIDAGHDRIALINGPHDVLASRERLRGYKAGLRLGGVKFDEALVRMQSYDEAYGYQQTRTLLEVRPEVTAIIAGSAMLSYGTLRALREAGRAVPDDIAMVACDAWRSPELFEPMPTVVYRDAGEIGRVAANLLLQGINDGVFRTVELPTTLVPGTALASPRR